MKKTTALLSALIFSAALMIPSLMWADDGKHMEEGSSKKTDKSSYGEYKDKKHSKGDMKEGYEKSADHKKKEEGSKDAKEKAEARKKEGS